MKKWLPLSLLILVFSTYGMDSIQSSALTLSKEPYPSTDFFPFDELPNDMIGEIFSFLEKKDWFNTFLVSKKFNLELTKTLEKMKGKEQFEQFKHHELLSQKKLYLNHLKKIATFWLKKNKQPKFRKLWNNPFLIHASNMNEESALNIISIFIQFAPKCGFKNFWVIYRGKNKLYTSDIAKKDMENYLTYYPKDLSNLLIWHFTIGPSEISFSKNKH